MPKPQNTEDEVLRRMLKMPPKQHAPLKSKAKPSRPKRDREDAKKTVKNSDES